MKKSFNVFILCSLLIFIIFVVPVLAAEYVPGDYDFSLTHDGLTRKYKVHVPPYYDSTKSTPVVIYLHGGGGSIEGAYNEGVNNYSDKYGFLLAVPAGTGLIADKLLTWNSGKWGGSEFSGYAYRNNIDDVGFINQMIDEIKSKFNVDGNRIYATGISNGGMMAYRLACELSNKIAAVAVVAAPAIPDNCSPSRPIPIMHVHGTADPCVPYNGGWGGGCAGSEIQMMESAQQMVDAWIQKNGCVNQSTIVYQKGKAVCLNYNQCGVGGEVEFCTVTDMGHTWPSGSQYLSIAAIGAVSYDISTDQIWDFFKNNALVDVYPPSPPSNVQVI